MKRHPFFLIGWLVTASVLLSLIGLTATPLPTNGISAGTVEVATAGL